MDWSAELHSERRCQGVLAQGGRDSEASRGSSRGPGVQHLRDVEAAGQAWGLGCDVCFSAAELQGKLSSSCSPYVLCTKGASGVRRQELLERDWGEKSKCTCLSGGL